MKKTKVGPSKRLAVETAMAAYEEGFDGLIGRLFKKSTLCIFNKRDQLLVRIPMKFKGCAAKRASGGILQTGTAKYFILNSDLFPECYYTGTVGRFETLRLPIYSEKLFCGEQVNIADFSFSPPEVCE